VVPLCGGCLGTRYERACVAVQPGKPEARSSIGSWTNSTPFSFSYVYVARPSFTDSTSGAIAPFAVSTARELGDHLASRAVLAAREVLGGGEDVIVDVEVGRRI
jgi:hypothetical protein